MNASVSGSHSGCRSLVPTSACAPRVAHGVELADVWSANVTLEAVAIWVWPNRAGEALLDPGEELLRLCWEIWRFSGVLVALSTRGRCMERGRRRAIASLSVLREGDGFRILRRRWFRMSRPGRGRPLCHDSVSCHAIS
ncbi:hypothetical protein Taro_010517 [Colocasia esculenta]|uniref:Uncharacterized protein n=1 Tax=Colocasia esculenta TaxID=4460 RepID=A0A843U764_COLES|nr:hypothetical protein [Colocasia esculenta]